TVTPVANNTWIHAAVATDDSSITANQTSRNNVTGATGSGADEDTGPISPAAATVVSYTNVGAAQTWAIGGYAIRPTSARPFASTLADNIGVTGGFSRLASAFRSTADNLGITEAFGRIANANRNISQSYELWTASGTWTCPPGVTSVKAE